MPSSLAIMTQDLRRWKRFFVACRIRLLCCLLLIAKGLPDCGRLWWASEDNGSRFSFSAFSARLSIFETVFLWQAYFFASWFLDI